MYATGLPQGHPRTLCAAQVDIRERGLLYYRLLRTDVLEVASFSRQTPRRVLGD